MAETIGMLRASGSGNKGRIGLVLSCETHYPPSEGSSVHVWQVWHRLQRMGYQIHTWKDQAVRPDKAYEWTPEGLAALMANVDLLYVRFPFTSAFSIGNMLRLLLRRRLPLICEFNGPLAEGTHEIARWTFWAIRHRLKLHTTNYLLTRGCVDHAICTCDQLAEYARRYFGLKEVTVLPMAGDPELFRPDLREAGRAALGLTDDDFLVFWGGGTAYAWQGLEHIFAAAEELQSDGVRFAIAGDREHLPSDLPSNVLTLGRQSYFDMPRFAAAADVCLCIYESHDWSPIGFYRSPGKLFDYMSCARASVASAMGQICQVIRDGQNGLLTDGSPDDIAEKIDFLRRNPQRREAMGRAARETIVREYNWQNVAERTHAIIASLLQKARWRRPNKMGRGSVSEPKKDRGS